MTFLLGVVAGWVLRSLAGDAELVLDGTVCDEHPTPVDDRPQSFTGRRQPARRAPVVMDPHA